MQKNILFLLFIALSLSLFAQSPSVRYNVKSSDYNRLVVSFSASDGLEVDNVVLGGHDFSMVSIAGFAQSSEIGAPSLPTMRKLIEIPLCDGIEVRVVTERHILLDGAACGVTNMVVPLQPPVCKSANRNGDTLVWNNTVYSRNDFYGLDVVTTAKVGIARDRNLAEVVFSPVKYNPVSNQFLVYTEVEVELTYRNVDIPSTEALKLLHHSPAFGNDLPTINSIQSSPNPEIRKFVSSSLSKFKIRNSKSPSASSAPIRYLIVSHSMFRGKFEEFVNWKRRTGYIVDVAYTDDAAVGTTQSSIKNYIKSQYTNATTALPAPTYLLFIGDVGQIPAKSYSYDGSSHVSDLDYACWTDGDNIPDCYYGRFSAQTVSQLTAQIEKTLLYERYEFPDPSFLDKALLVAGQDNGSSWDKGYTHADPAMDYAAKFYVNGDSKSVLGQSGFYKYATVIEYKNNTSINMNASNVTVKANSLQAEIRGKYSEGAGWINYSAHGNADRWHYPQLTVSQVASMTNSKKCGIMIGNCCLTGKFDENTCLAEALLRKDNYCGAVAYIGGSNSTYWNQDVYWAVGIRSDISGGMTQQYDANRKGVYDHLFHTHSEQHSEWASTLGSMVWYGNMSVQNSGGTSSSMKAYYWQIYHVFGDPSLMPWLTQAKEMTLSYSWFQEGSSHISVTSVPYAYLAITDNNYNLIGAAFADANGVADIACNLTLGDENYFVSAMAQNYQPKVVSLDQMEPVYTVSVKCFPVPASTAVNITIIGSDESVEYEIVDLSGRIIYTGGEENGNLPHTVDVSPLVAGTYIVRAKGSTFTASAKMVVAH